ncbi:uncharacterized protein N7482_009210 [Penicillium canariense]|uniref:N-acetyltransferase domain-containing protein n=1 Tax=Penicillium canariense TaxID=189055 RepID=A0A9W9HNQ0_9EURO|nr:uncharacterized protein N7482_009210 [Penicillium canariense]KAJ5152732.1 hypothetical protein N7482_009210 [Penicillium canariense]
MAVSSSSSLQFKVLPATEEDCAAMAMVETVSNCAASKVKPEHNLACVLFGPPGDTSVRTKDFIDKLQNDKTARMWKAVTTDPEGQEKVVALSLWHFYLEAVPIEDWKDIEWPASANSDGCNKFFRDVVAMRKKHMTERRFGFLQVLATLPEYRGYGIGSALLKEGLDEGMNSGLTDFWLEASNDGHDLYEKFGFQDVEPIPVDLAKYGGEGMARLRAMRRLPN